SAVSALGLASAGPSSARMVGTLFAPHAVSPLLPSWTGRLGPQVAKSSAVKALGLTAWNTGPARQYLAEMLVKLSSNEKQSPADPSLRVWAPAVVLSSVGGLVARSHR